ncbi:peptidylprolyl isomerase [Brevundimonas sp.]|uniref:peptidylprolyl isomerase n=1 Tax=Brevundimonas sp. TaxID=1871086 RepID=UPI001A27B364|nr:peptidylprolyl isomerase [Brevundimonas sp.]MBJ7485648.1 peptidylprolyl isomerase [Brevundimonas sp.]
MRLIRCSTGVALAALVAGGALAQTAPVQTPAPAAAGTLNPAAEQTPATPPAAPPQFQLSEGIIATVNDQIITSFDLRQRMLMIIAMSQVQPTEENIPAIQQQALNALIEERLQVQEIAKYPDLTITDAEVDEEVARMAEDAGTTPANYMQFLEQGGIRARNMREQLRTEIGWRALVGGRFNNRAKVSRAAVDQAMRQVTEAASKPQYLIGEIYIEAARVGGQQAAATGAEQLVQQMVAGAPFQAVARQFSAAPSAPRGGDAGWVVQGTVQPALQVALDQLEVGQLSRPIPVEGGVYIIYMRDKRSGAATSLVTLKQIMIEAPETASPADVAAATARLEALRPQLTCDTMLARATSEQGLLGSDLGEADVANLAPQFQQVARTAEVGTVSTPVRTPLGVHLVAVCGRRVGGADAPTYQQVEGRLQNQNLAMLARRYIRDLRADALIELK